MISPLALIGMPGVGKSSVGQRLSEKMGMPVYDTDALCEQEAGLSVSEIFAQKGEAYFRALEARVLAECVHKGSGIIACGGGTPISPPNARILKQNCFVVYLQASVQTLCKRVAGTQTRPLLAGDAEARIKELSAARENAYKDVADITVDTNGCTTEQAAEKVMCTLARHNKKWTEKFSR